MNQQLLETPRNPRGSGRKSKNRSIRVNSWNRAQRRATLEGVTMARVINLFVDAYAQGLLDLPRVKMTYTQVREPSEPDDEEE